MANNQTLTVEERTASIQARVEYILSIVDQAERDTDSAADRLEILEAVLSDVSCRVDATREDVRRGR